MCATEKLTFPLPKCKRLILKMFADWNANKSGSDIRSKYASITDFLPAASNLIQSKVVGGWFTNNASIVSNLYCKI